VKDLILNGMISINYIKFELNLADPLTKGLTKNCYQRSCAELLHCHVKL